MSSCRTGYIGQYLCPKTYRILSVFVLHCVSSPLSFLLSRIQDTIVTIHKLYSTNCLCLRQAMYHTAPITVTITIHILSSPLSCHNTAGHCVLVLPHFLSIFVLPTSSLLWPGRTLSTTLCGLALRLLDLCHDQKARVHSYRVEWVISQCISGRGSYFSEVDLLHLKIGYF